MAAVIPVLTIKLFFTGSKTEGIPISAAKFNTRGFGFPALPSI
jgi:hypothetical protein